MRINDGNENEEDSISDQCISCKRSSHGQFTSKSRSAPIRDSDHSTDNVTGECDPQAGCAKSRSFNTSACFSLFAFVARLTFVPFLRLDMNGVVRDGDKFFLAIDTRVYSLEAVKKTAYKFAAVTS